MAALNLRLASNVMRRSGASDAVILKTLHILARTELNELHDGIQERIALNARIKNIAEAKGNVAVVESGMDCDCVSYSGVVHTVSSNIPEFWKFIDDMHSHAEGSISWYLTSTAEAKNIRYNSCDLALQAYEDGHPHVIYA